MATNFPHRTEDTLMGSSDEFVQALDLSRRPVINAESGGMWGWAGNVFEYVSAQPHVQQQSYCVVLSTPNAFSRLPGGRALHSLCKSFFENRTQSFEGLRDQTEISFAEIKWAGKTLSIPSGSTRTLGFPTHNVYDVEGEPFTKMLKVWCRFLLMDPELQSPKLVILPDPGDMLIDDISAAVVYFEPTRNLKDVSHAQLSFAMMPRTDVPIELRRNKDDEGVIRLINQEFTATIESDTYAAKEIARTILSQMPLYDHEAITAPEGFKERTSTLTSLTDSGTIERMVSESAKTISDVYIG